MRYGTVQRLWGIIIMEQAALPFRTKSLKGKGSMLYGSNGRRFVLTGQMEGTFPFLRDIAWRVQEPARIQETVLPRTIFLTIPE